MIFNIEIGKIYDTIFLGVLQFHKKALFERLDDFLIDRKWFDRLNAELTDLNCETEESLPEILSPFFLCSKAGNCALTAFFTGKIDYAQDTFNSFLEKLKTNSDLLFAKLMDAIFPDRPFGNPSSLTLPLDTEILIKALNEASYSQEVKLQIALLFGNYPYALALLVKHLQLLYKQIDALYSAHENEIAHAAEEMQQRRNLTLYEQVYTQFTSKAFRKELPFYNSISLLHSLLFYLASNGTSYLLISGIQHEDALRFATRQNDDLRSILLAIGNDTRLSILKVLSEQGEMTSADVARALGIAPSAAFTHMDILFQKGILSFVRRQGLRMFYKINYPVLRNALRLAGTFLDIREKGNGC